MRQGHVVVILQAPAHRAIAHTFLAFLQLLQEPEIARDFDNCLWTEAAT